MIAPQYLAPERSIRRTVSSRRSRRKRLATLVTALISPYIRLSPRVIELVLNFHLLLLANDPLGHEVAEDFINLPRQFAESLHQLFENLQVAHAAVQGLPRGTANAELLANVGTARPFQGREGEKGILHDPLLVVELLVRHCVIIRLGNGNSRPSRPPIG